MQDKSYKVEANKYLDGITVIHFSQLSHH